MEHTIRYDGSFATGVRPIGSSRSGRHAMAKLIVMRPRLGDLWDNEDYLDVLIDGNPGASLGPGEEIVIHLPLGSYQVLARIKRGESQPVVLEMVAGEARRLAVGPNLAFYRLFNWFLILVMGTAAVGAAWLVIDVASHVQTAKAGTISTDANWRSAWQMAMTAPSALMIVLLTVAIPALRQTHEFVVIELGDSDLTVEQIAELLRKRSSRVRITIRQLVIAVAILALWFWCSQEVFRWTRVSELQSQASLHGDLERLFRGQNNAKADYHAAMQRKYAEAAASRSFSVP